MRLPKTQYVSALGELNMLGAALVVGERKLDVCMNSLAVTM